MRTQAILSLHPVHIAEKRRRRKKIQIRLALYINWMHVWNEFSKWFRKIIAVVNRFLCPIQYMIAKQTGTRSTREETNLHTIVCRGTINKWIWLIWDIDLFAFDCNKVNISMRKKNAILLHAPFLIFNVGAHTYTCIYICIVKLWS